jgi:photosystem II stability/assembly factor-like uncharacterized protein
MKTKSILLAFLLAFTASYSQNTEWEIQSPLPTHHDLNDVKALSPHNVVAVGNHGTHLYTPDVGQNWQHKESGTINTLNSIHFASHQVGWAAGEGGTILKTKNGKQNWISLNSGISIQKNAIQFINSLVGWELGGSGASIKLPMLVKPGLFLPICLN